MRQYRFTTQSLPQLTSWVGFENLFDEIERAQTAMAKTIKYPPYNIRKLDDNHYCIEMAVAGFGKSDIDISTKDNELVVKGEMKLDPNAEYLHKGIAERSFSHMFPLADKVTVKNASMINGMLKIWLEHFIPEEEKPRKIDISDADTPELKTVPDTKQFLTE